MANKIRSYNGKEVDMEALVAANERTQAVGNMKVNARGDVLDDTGRVVQSKEERAREYNKEVKTNVVKSSILDDIEEIPEIKQDPNLKKKPAQKSPQKGNDKSPDALDDQDFEPLNDKSDDKK